MPSLALLCAQALAVLLACRCGAAAARRLGQPGVVGEIAGGLLLGPSALGALWPGAQTALFPPDSLAPLRLLGQIGLLVFLYTVGLGLDLGALRARARAAALVSQASIAAPLALGLALGLWLHPRFAPEAPRLAFASFLGVAMSVTAFPVLARILVEKRLERTPLGATALACAAFDDVAAWAGLAAVTAAVAGSGRPLATLGAHALLVAFVAGVATPGSPGARERLARPLAPASTWLLPLFFALTGLRTRIGLLDGPGAWSALALVLAAAVAGKLGAGALAARASGLPWRESLALGALMNARGLVELVILNAGYELGVLPPSVFAMMVLMALITTAMTGPLLDSLKINKRPLS